MRAGDILRRMTLLAGVKNPERITATLMRKYTATVCQLMTLNDNQRQWLCSHLGHNTDVHKEYYQ